MKYENIELDLKNTLFHFCKSTLVNNNGITVNFSSTKEILNISHSECNEQSEVTLFVKKVKNTHVDTDEYKHLEPELYDLILNSYPDNNVPPEIDKLYSISHSLMFALSKAQYS